MSEMAFEHVFYLENFECAGDEVLVESSPPASPEMAARLAAPAQQGAGAAVAGGGSPTDNVRELIVIPEINNSIQLQHAIQQVSSTVVEVNGDSSGRSSPTAADTQHTYITVASEGGNGVNYHVQYVEPQEIYTHGQQTNMETLRTYPVYGVTSVENPTTTETADNTWINGEGQYTAYGVVVARGTGDEAPASPRNPQNRMPPATVQWLLEHYETAEGVSLPRSTLYAHYLRHCSTHRLDPVNAASFGKLIRSVFVGLRTRRLGTRGNSKYHYYGIRAKAAASLPASPTQLDGQDSKCAVDPAVGIDAFSQESREREGEAGCAGGAGGAGGLAGVAYRQYLGAVSPPAPPPPPDAAPADLPPAALHALQDHHREHGAEFLEAVAALDTSAVERCRRAFWRRPPPQLCKKVLWKLAARKDIALWLKKADMELYQKAVELLLPDVLRPIPPQLTQAIRNFAKSLEGALAAGADGVPAPSGQAQRRAGAALAGALRRYTSLNHLAQAARAVLTNVQQIQQMVSDLNRVDFRVVREQAAWACACPSAAAASRIEHDFKATLSRGATLEQWASWLESCVGVALSAHERRPDYTARARRLLLDWSFYSSLVIRELTLRSAASFGSFHLLRLLYDEYVSFLVERRVAAHSRSPPIAVMHDHSAEEDDDLSEDGGRPSGGEGDGGEGGEGEAGEGEGVEGEEEWEWDDEEEEEDEPEAKRAKT